MRNARHVQAALGSIALLVSGVACGSGGKASAGGSGGVASSSAAGGSTPSASTSTAASAATSGAGGVSGAGGASSTSGAGGAASLDCATPPCINVINNCPFPLWIHAQDNQGVTLMPDDAPLSAAPHLKASGTVQYPVPASWPAGRVNAYWVDPGGPNPDPNAYDKVEVTVGNGMMNYNITYVDYAALPSRMEAVGPSCPTTSTFNPTVSCEVPVISFLANCPMGLRSGQRCLSAGLFCSMSANTGSAFCHALDAQIAACEQQSPATCGLAAQLGNGTPNAYGCSGYFDSQQPNGCTTPSTTCHVDGNKWCAALNRGMLAQPDSTDATQFYKNAPFNAYAQWVHETCPGIYAFAYDDYPSGAGQSGFRSCTAGRLDVTFCPSG